MLGSIIGDIVGSIYESQNIKSKEFPFWGEDVGYTDDSLLTIGTARWLLLGGNVADSLIHISQNNKCMRGGYGSKYASWLYNAVRNGIKYPYYSCGNGSAMRVGPVGWAFDTEQEVLQKAKESAECTHNHPEGIKGAQAVALAILMARNQETKERIEEKLLNYFQYDMGFSIEELQKDYGWFSSRWGNGALCQGSVPQAIRAFLDGNDFEDCIRNAISIGGDSDTIACITGSIAEAYYGIPESIYKKGFSFLNNDLKRIVSAFEDRFGNNIIVQKDDY